MIRFCDPRPPNCVWFHLLLWTYDHFIKPNPEKCKITFLITKRDRNSYSICVFDPRPPNCGWFHFLFLTYDHFIKPKPEKRKIPFLVTKKGQTKNHIRHVFLICEPQFVGGFICYFWLMTILSRQKLKNFEMHETIRIDPQ